MSEKYKEIYHYELPVDVNFEWSKIEAKLDSKERKKRLLWWFFPGVSLIVITLFTSMHLLNNNNDKKAILHNQLIHEIELPKTTLEHKDVSATRTYEKLVANKSINENKELGVNLNSNLNKTSKTISSGEVIKNILSDEIKNNNLKVNDDLVQQKHFSDDLFHEKNSIQDNVIDLVDIPMISSELVCLSCEEYEMSGFIEKEISRLNPKVKLVAEIMYGGGGRSINNTSATKEYIALRNKTEKVLDVLKARVLYQYELPNKLSISTGLDMSKVTERFSFVGESVERIKQDVEALIIYTDHTGNITTSSGTKETLKTYEINLLKYNNYYSIGIPIQIGYAIPINKMELEFTSGINIPIYTSYSGKIFNAEGGLSDIDEIPIKKEFILKANHGIKMNYTINNHLKCSVGAFGEYDLRNSVEFKTYTQSYYTIAGNIGLIYQFQN